MARPQRGTHGGLLALGLLLVSGSTAALEVDDRRTLLTLPKATYDGLIEIPILSPVPLTGGWIGGHTMRIGGELAMDIINSQQQILPGYRLSTSWFDDKCNPDYGPALMLEQWNAGNFAALGANGCSAVCRATALLSTSIRMPHISYGCAAGFLADNTTFPGFARLMTDESAMAIVFQALGHRFGWTKMVIITGQAARFDGPAAALMEYFRHDPIDVEWLTPRDPSWEDLLGIMKEMKRTFQRVIVVLSYEPFYRRAVCAAIVAGIPKGVVWLSVGWHKVGWWTEEDPALLALEPRCTAATITEYYTGGIGPAGSGAPLPSQMEDPLDCLQGYTSKSFRELFEPHATVDGYPLGENILPGAPYAEIVPYGADGICTWAYTFREMIINRGYSLAQLIRPSQAIYEEMVHYIKFELQFWGVSGKVFWNGGNNKPGTLAVNQLQGGEWKLVSMVDLAGALVDQAGEVLVWGDGETAPPSSFAPCPVGTIRDAAGKCQPCIAGTYFFELLGECVPCELGEYNPDPGTIGAANCRKCPDGTVAMQKGSVACAACPAGQFSNGMEGNGAFCVQCPAGRSQASPASPDCERCDIGTYQGDVGQTACEICAEGRTTRFFSATSPYECVCPEGRYEPWPLSPGRPFMCESCPEGMTCPEGSRLGDWFGTGNVSQVPVYPLLQEQYFSKPDEPVSVFKCLDERDCPGGDPGTCAVRREGIACGRCEKKYYSFGGKCNACSEVELSSALFPTLPLLVCPVVVAFIYTRLLEPMNIKHMDNPKNRALALGFFFLVHFQTLGLINQFNLVLPSLVKVPWEGLGMINSGVQFLRPECSSGGAMSDFAAQFAFRTALPLFVGLFFILDYFAAKAMVVFTKKLKRGPDSIWTKGMDVDCTINAYGTLMYTFSIAVLAIAFDLFKCFPHPNDTASLRVSPDVMCYESEWNGLLVIGILAILVYFVFSFSLFSHVLRQAPARFGEGRFRRRWKFLLVKWRSNRWWFGQVFLLKGVSLNLTLVLFKSGALQVLWMGLTLMLYIVLVMVVKPWRHTAANIMDSVITLALLSISLVTIYYSGRSEEADAALDKVLAILTFLPLPIVLVACGRLIYVWRKRPNAEVEDGMAITHAIEKLIVRVSGQGPLSLMHGLLSSTSADRLQILHSLELVLAESTSTQVPGAVRLLQRTATAGDVSSNPAADQQSSWGHSLLQDHFRNQGVKGVSVQQQVGAVFGDAPMLSSTEFERRFKALLSIKGGAGCQGSGTDMLSKYAAMVMDPYGEQAVRAVVFREFALAMRMDTCQSLANMAVSIEA